MNLQEIQQFIKHVKSGVARGDYQIELLTENIAFEVSVGSFEYGHIHIQLLIQDEELLELPDDAYVQQSFRIDSQYQAIYDEIVELLVKENESSVTNAHSWERKKIPEDHPSIPEEFNPRRTIVFEDFIRIHEDLSIDEAIRTNRLRKSVN